MVGFCSGLVGLVVAGGILGFRIVSLSDCFKLFTLSFTKQTTNQKIRKKETELHPNRIKLFIIIIIIICLEYLPVLPGLPTIFGFLLKRTDERGDPEKHRKKKNAQSA